MKTILITGSSSGLGKCLALEFAKHGYSIILNGRNLARLRQVKTEIKKIQEKLKTKPFVNFIRGDITDQETMMKILKRARRVKLDVFINNAGIYAHKPFTEMTSQEIRDIIEINMIAPIQLISKLYPLFLRRQAGLIININSVAGRLAYEMEAVYCASKQGLAGFSRSFQAEANRHEIRVFSVFPGAMQTAMTSDRDSYPNLMKPEEVAATIYGLVRDYKSLRILEIDIARKGV